MSDAFDPYHVWLGIPPAEQPAHHYRLLGVAVFESSAEVIEGAADKQMAHLRTFQAGKHSALSQRLLNEVAAARICLLNPAKKQAYDAQLRVELEQAARQPSEFAAVAEMVSAEPSSSATRGRRPSGLSWQALASIGVGALVLLAVAVYMFSGESKPQIAQEGANREADAESRVRIVEAPAPKPASQPEPPPPAPAVPEAPAAPVKPDAMQVGSPPKAPALGAEKTPSEPPRRAEATSAAARKRRKAATPSLPAPAAAAVPAQPEPQEEQPKRLAVPDEAARERANKLVRDTFREEFAKATTPAAGQALAKKLIDERGDVRSDPAGCFAILQAARDTAVEAGDGPTAFEAIDKMAEHFLVDPFAMKAEVLAGFARAARTPAAHRALAEKTVTVMEEALGENSLPVAGQLGKLALAEAGKARDKDLIKQARGRIKDADQAAKAFADVEVALAALKEKPNDPEANATAGRFTCFVKGDWDAGLAMLAKGGDAALKDLAAKDLQRPEKSGEQIALADAWYELADQEGGPAKKRIQLRAAHWYWIAAPQLTGLEKTKVEKRMRALANLVASRHVPDRIVNRADGSVLVLIPAGRFLAGPKKFPVELPAYYLGMYEVTNEQYKKFMDATGARPPSSWRGNSVPAGLADCAVNSITWQDAKDYCRWAGLRLPTELEWEKGARGVDGRSFPWGNEWDESKCRNKSNLKAEGNHPSSVSGYPQGRSPWGLFHMCGNVWQYCEDWYDKLAYQRYQRGDLTLPATSSDTPPRRVLRGGCYDGTQSHNNCVARTSRVPDVDRHPSDGFRVAKSVMP